MARHSFIQMSKLSNVKGRISYISDPKRQEYLYATFSTREDMTFWNDRSQSRFLQGSRFCSGLSGSGRATRVSRHISETS